MVIHLYYFQCVIHNEIHQYAYLCKFPAIDTIVSQRYWVAFYSRTSAAAQVHLSNSPSFPFRLLIRPFSKCRPASLCASSALKKKPHDYAPAQYPTMAHLIIWLVFSFSSRLCLTFFCSFLFGPTKSEPIFKRFVSLFMSFFHCAHF